MLLARKPNTFFQKHMDGWFRFSCRYSHGRLSQEICVPDCGPLVEPWPMNICANCRVKHTKKGLMLHSAFSKNWAARRVFAKKMGNTSFTATAVQLLRLRRIILKHVCWRNHCSLR